MRLEGKIDGNIYTEGRLILAQGAFASGKLTGKFVEIYGEVDGDVVGVEELVLNATAVVKGNLFTNQVTIEKGADFSGRLHSSKAHSLSVDGLSENQMQFDLQIKEILNNKHLQDSQPYNKGLQQDKKARAGTEPKKEVKSKDQSEVVNGKVEPKRNDGIKVNRW
ncbi:bactofilin family protein [Echinicola marina]|uniref:bactofilin family protein n=1 Tax=Echinicola marina TaxID=2859768 RepID=UPI001CF6593C|nr:polymer-forming cytoskeletal protein [Echinicola marina]